MAEGFVIAAPRSGSGKTLVTLGLVAALRALGRRVAPAKVGPDYIDAAILSRTAGRPALNLDPWAMPPAQLRGLAAKADGDLLVVEGVMGLFDGAVDGTGSTGDLAATLNLPVVLVVDAEKQAQSVAPLVAGFAHWRPDVKVAAMILNRVSTTRHEAMLRQALAATGIPVLGALPRREALALPDRHLGLVLPGEVEGFGEVVRAAASAVADYLDLDLLQTLAAEIAAASPPPALPPLGQRIAVARDNAFAFLYEHLLAGWRAQGAELTFFSPLANEAPAPDADAVYLPGGYPELHGAALANARNFKAGLIAARENGALIYGECGGYMVLGESLVDKGGVAHEMANLLPITTRIDRPRRTLGYRHLRHAGALPWPADLRGHEFHYSSGSRPNLPPLFTAANAGGRALEPMGAVLGRVTGSYAHVIA